MKHLKLYENFDDELLLDVVKSQALQFNKRDMLDYAIKEGFDLPKHMVELIRYCRENGLHDSVQMIHPDTYQWQIDNITVLNVTGKKLKRLQLNSLVNLKELYCYDNNLTDIKGIEKLTNLEVLNITNNDLTNLKGIENLIYLKELSVSNNKLTHLKEIENIKNLTHIYASHCQLGELNVGKLTNLRHIDCGVNELNSLDVSKLINLVELHCGKNKLTYLDVSNLDKLFALDCCRNKLTVIEGLGDLRSLEKINCEYNKLTTLKGVENSHQLQYIFHKNNNFPQEIVSFGNDITGIKNYYRGL